LKKMVKTFSANKKKAKKRKEKKTKEKNGTAYSGPFFDRAENGLSPELAKNGRVGRLCGFVWLRIIPIHSLWNIPMGQAAAQSMMTHSRPPARREPQVNLQKGRSMRGIAFDHVFIIGPMGYSFEFLAGHRIRKKSLFHLPQGAPLRRIKFWRPPLSAFLFLLGC